MTDAAPNMEINISGKSYQVAFAEDEREALLRAVDYLNQQIQEIKDKNHSHPNESLLAITALNITNELLTHRYLMESNDTAIDQKLKAIIEKLSGICRRTDATPLVKDFGTTL